MRFRRAGGGLDRTRMLGGTKRGSIPPSVDDSGSLDDTVDGEEDK